MSLAGSGWADKKLVAWDESGGQFCCANCDRFCFHPCGRYVFSELAPISHAVTARSGHLLVSLAVAGATEAAKRERAETSAHGEGLMKIPVACRRESQARSYQGDPAQSMVKLERSGTDGLARIAT
jgi:hypothetical protein